MNKRNKLLLVALVACMPALGLHAQITIKRQNTTVGTVIKQIQKQTGYRFFFDDKIAKTKVDRFNVNDASLSETLSQLLGARDIDYSITDKVIYLKQKPKAPKTEPIRPSQTPKTLHKVTGQIVDEHGEPLIGATVKEKGGQGMAVTDIDGNYTIESDEDSPVLVYNYLGYKPQVVNADHRNVVNVNMTADTTPWVRSLSLP